MKDITAKQIWTELRFHGSLLVGIAAMFWVIEIVDLCLGGTLDVWGIRPRAVEGLIGIPLAPFLHGGLWHVAANTLPFLVLGGLVLLRETWHFYVVSAISIVLGGLGVWLVGASSSVHIGASGLIFGYFGYLLLSGWFERRLLSIGLSVLVLLTYGSLIFGVLPGQPGISWEGHLFGFLAGILAARLLAKKRSKVIAGASTT